MTKANIVAVDDEEDILELVEYNLSRDGYAVKCVTTGEQALAAARADHPDLIVLDLMLPGIDGLEVCRQLRRDERTTSIPILMLTARGEEADIVTGLELGADDYLTKPFSPRVLLARVRAVLRRVAKQNESPASSAMIKRGDLVIDSSRREARVRGKEAELTYTEFGLLTFLAARPGWVFTRNQIIDAVHGEDYPVTDRSVDVQVVGLRKKLGPCGEYIETVRGVGYRFRD